MIPVFVCIFYDIMCCRNMTSCSQTLTGTNVFHPHQLSTSCHPPAYTPAVSMTLQQKVYRLNPIEFDRPVKRELPVYVDVNDPKWSADPRVRPCIQLAVTSASESTNTNGIGLSFYSSGGGRSPPDTGSVVQQLRVGGIDVGASSYVPLISTNDAVVHNNSGACDSPSVRSSPVKNVCSENGTTACESTPSLPVKQENFSDSVVKSEPTDVTNSASAPVARHTFQHNVSWLTRSSGIQKLSQAKNEST